MVRAPSRSQPQRQQSICARWRALLNLFDRADDRWGCGRRVGREEALNARRCHRPNPRLRLKVREHGLGAEAPTCLRKGESPHFADARQRAQHTRPGARPVHLLRCARTRRRRRFGSPIARRFARRVTAPVDAPSVAALPQRQHREHADATPPPAWRERPRGLTATVDSCRSHDALCVRVHAQQTGVRGPRLLRSARNSARHSAALRFWLGRSCLFELRAARRFQERAAQANSRKAASSSWVSSGSTSASDAGPPSAPVQHPSSR